MNKRMLYVSAKRVWDDTRQGRKGDPLGIVQEVWSWP